MVILGLTGGSGAGKSRAARYLSYGNCAVIDCDAVYADLVSKRTPCTDSISAAFGEEALNADGSLNRVRLASIVFGEGGEEKLKLLNSTVHPHVIAKVESLIDNYSKSGIELIIIDAPQLFEANADRLCDFTVFVTAKTETRVRRICERDGIPQEKAIMRINSQHSDEYFESRCDFKLANDEDEEELKKQCESLLAVIKSKTSGETK